MLGRVNTQLICQRHCEERQRRGNPEQCSGLPRPAKNAGLAMTLVTFFLILSGCASSNVTRDVSSGVDMGVHNARSLADGATDGDMVDAYQNTNQATKGAIIGGTAGGVTGAVAATSIGFFPGAVAGAIMGASYGSYIDSNTSPQDQLENRGANVIVLGDQVMVVIPSARIFDPMTSHINPSAYSTLELLARFINGYDKMLVKIGVYTNDLSSDRVNKALAQAQARNVARYLQASGVDARLLYAVGYGGVHLVEKNSKIWDGSDNYRIEVTLEKLQG